MANMPCVSDGVDGADDAERHTPGCFASYPRQADAHMNQTHKTSNIIPVAFATGAVAMLFLAVVSWVHNQNSGLVVWRRLVEVPPVLYMALSLIMMILSVLSHYKHSTALITAGMSFFIITLLVAPLAFSIVGPLHAEHDSSSYVSPDGDMVVIVERRTHSIDPVWIIRLEQTRGLGARYWYIGCVDGDYETLTSVAWHSGSKIEFIVDGRSIGVEVKNKRPSRLDPVLLECHY